MAYLCTGVRLASDQGGGSKLLLIRNIQGDQKVSVHLFLYCNHQVHRDFLITLYYAKSNLRIVEMQSLYSPGQTLRFPAG